MLPVDEKRIPYVGDFAQMWDERESAQRLRLSVATLRRRRRRRQPPAWVKLGYRIFYRESDLREFIETSVVHPDQPLTDPDNSDPVGGQS